MPDGNSRPAVRRFLEADTRVASYRVLRHRAPLAVEGPDPSDSLGNTTTPVLPHHGPADVWAGGKDIDDLEAELIASGGPHGVYRYPGAGHAFEEPGSRGFRPVADAEARTRTLTSSTTTSGRGADVPSSTV